MTAALDPKEYARLQGSVTHIPHNAWPVDFNRHFSRDRADPQLQCVRDEFQDSPVSVGSGGNALCSSLEMSWESVGAVRNRLANNLRLV